MGLLLKHLNNYVARKTQDFSITANLIVLFLLWVIKDVIFTFLMTTLPQFMWIASISTSTLAFFTCLGTQASSVDQQIFQSKCAS